MVVTEETANGTQYLIPFDFFEDEEKERQRKQEEKIASYKYLPRYENPDNDNQRLFNLQYDYYNGSRKALDEIFIILNRIAPRLVNIEMHRHKLVLQQEAIDEAALESTMLFIEQIKTNELVIKTSFIAYLRLQVIKVLFDETNAERFAKWCLKNHIDIFSQDTETAEALKRTFQKEIELVPVGYREY